mgnify:CR=1 FL=1|jgi:hypothetical protein|tara:strand:+ start:10262 stop:10732 length:471 start_codon:yes stop_codon:yes gene_type:complete
MTKYEIVKGKKKHAYELQRTMREADKMEIMASNLKTPKEALRGVLESRGEVWAGLADKKVVCMYGVIQLSVLGDAGVPWLLASDLITVHARRFLRENKKFIAAMRKEFGQLVNYVDERNIEAKRWLQWLGFELEEAAPYGILQRPFHKFTMECRDV